MVEIGENTKISQEVVLKRLGKIEGQIRGIQKMIVEDRDCVSLVIHTGSRPFCYRERGRYGIKKLHEALLP